MKNTAIRRTRAVSLSVAPDQRGCCDTLVRTSDLEEVVLRLPVRERARPVRKLLESLDQPSEDEVRSLGLDLRFAILGRSQPRLLILW